MITSNVIHRTFRFRYKGDEATAFTIEVDNREYLVTAKHVIKDFQNSESVEVFGNGAWQTQEASLVGHAEGDHDISVLALKTVLTPPRLPLPAISKGVTYGQDVYFLGFPYGFMGPYIFGSQGFPMPFVKRATVSLFGRGLFFLDGHNNPGFSGGPVVFSEPGRFEYKVCAVVSGFEAVEEPVYQGDKKLYGKTGEPIVFRYNTGIVVAWAIDSAIQLIMTNSIGVEVSNAG